jgi:branched-subunit amino acid transport protein AzlD
MRLAGYTFGQILVIGVIAILAVYALRRFDSMVQVPGVHSLATGI